MSASRSSQFRTIYIDQKGSVLSDLQRLTAAFSVRVIYFGDDLYSVVNSVSFWPSFLEQWNPSVVVPAFLSPRMCK